MMLVVWAEKERLQIGSDVRADILMDLFKRTMAGTIIGCALVAVSCREAEIFETLADQVAYPAAIASDDDHFYVVNADLERRYNAGSILTLSHSGAKKGVLTTPRLGRFIVRRGSLLMVGHPPTDQYRRPPLIRFYDSANPAKLRTIASLKLKCSPINAVAPEDYPYFAISCMKGQLYIGIWPQNPLKSAPQLHLVRDYGPHARRALFIDTKQHVVYALSTDWQQAQFRDVVLEDRYDYSHAPRQEKGNGIPDVWEDPQALKEAQLTTEENNEVMREYQMAVYSLQRGRQRNFPYLGSHHSRVREELIPLYFKARTPEKGPVLEAHEKYYRSNFWQAAPDPNDERSFLVSQRGYQSEDVNLHTNAIYRFTITSSPFFENGKLRRKVEDFLKVEHFWGHAASESVRASHLNSNLRTSEEGVALKNENLRFTGNFALSRAHKSSYLIVNDFRDTSFLPNSAYSLSLKRVHGSGGFDDYYLLHRDRSQSFFALSAVGTQVLAGSFYTNALSLFSITKDFKLRLSKKIR